MQDFKADVRYALRLLIKNRGFTLAALLTLTLCIGANSAIFSIVNSVLIRPLSFPQPDQLVRFFQSYPNAGAARGSNASPDYFDRKAGMSSLDELALIRSRGFTIGEVGAPERVSGVSVTPSFFRMLRVPAYRGRWFTEDEAEPGKFNKVILSYGMWQERFGGRDDAIGKTLRVDGESYEVVGIMPRKFVVDDAGIRMWTPLFLSAEARSDDARHNNNFDMLGRLKPGFTVVVAQQQVDAINRAIDERMPQFHEILVNAGFRSLVVSYPQDLVRDVAGTLWLLQAGVLLVLLIGGVNLANLLLVRSTTRSRELATRAALGAARRRLVRQLLTESVVLAVVGGIFGLMLAYALTRAFAGFAADIMPRGDEVRLDWPVALGTLLLSMIAGLLFGTIPVVRVLRTNLSSVFREEGRNGTASRGALIARGGMVIAQVALAFALLIATGLMLASFQRTLRVDTGFEARNVLTASVALPAIKYTTPESRVVAYQQLLERIRTIPGVQAAGYSNVIPFGGDFNSSVLTAEGYVPKPGESLYSPANSNVSPGYFEAMGIELVKGRTFNESDTENALPVMMIDEALARRYWPNRDPIGKRAYQGVPEISGEEREFRTVVGVVKSVRLSGFTGDQPDGHYYWPTAQDPLIRAYLTIRTTVDPISITSGLRSAAVAIDPDLPVYDVRTMEERTSTSLATEKLRVFLLLGFAAVAVFLSGVGLYGVLAYTVAQRASELCIRMALGSSTREIFRMVLGNGLKLTAIGLGIGLAVSLAFSRFMQSLLFGVEPTEPVVFVAVIALLGLAAAAACYVPARRATQLEPMGPLRS
ncbi:MAG: ABC transporter permease [Gemmatimonadota bacterium]